jgi:hypothetical protein
MGSCKTIYIRTVTNNLNDGYNKATIEDCTVLWNGANEVSINVAKEEL